MPLLPDSNDNADTPEARLRRVQALTPEHLRNLPPPTAEPLICFCGAPMAFAGYGAYPYDCTAKDKCPDAAIYYAVNCEHQGWDYHRPKPLRPPV
jgi:hypothetical protein